MSDTKELLGNVRKYATEFLGSLPTRPVHSTANAEQLRARLAFDFRDAGESATDVLDALMRDADDGIVAMAGPRFFGFVIGGSLPVAMGADWLVSTWDQNAGLYVTSPAVSVMEETAARWLLDALHLPATSGVGFVTGGQMANFTCLAAARDAVLRRAGWNVAENGISGAPKVNVLISEEAHVTISFSFKLLGIGSKEIRTIPCDAQGRMKFELLAEALKSCEGPTIVCAQAGNVNSGAFDPVGEIARITRERNAWLHVDSAFGLWAAAAPDYAHLVRGIGNADSWATDAHKWLNVPFDCGIAIVADAAAHRAAMTLSAAYLEQGKGEVRDELDWVPEFSRRARSVPVYAALRSLGRSGVAEMISRGCRHASLFAEILGAESGVEILNDVVLNQVLVRFGESDPVTRAVVSRVQEDGVCWLSGTTWHGVAAMRISVCNWSTSEEDVKISAEAILSAFRSVTA